jgi:hypothetical protein
MQAAFFPHMTAKKRCEAGRTNAALCLFIIFPYIYFPLYRY